MSLKVFLCLALVGLVAAEAGQKGYSPKYNLKTYGNPSGPFFGVNGLQGNSGAGYPLNTLAGYGYGSYANNVYGLGTPLHYGSHVGYNNYGTQGGFPGYGLMNGRSLNVLSGYGNYGVYGNGVMPFKGYGFGQRLGGYGRYNNLIGSGAFGIGRVIGYGPHVIGGINGYGAYGMGGFGGIGGLNGNRAYGLGGLNGFRFRNHKYGYSGVGKFGGKKGTY
ncbi:Hypothetical predicted protein [Mytilus galloprovincialis]|uniref:Uncharacterized protein n=1 Tax=Mytilus galloprovincialis TaxID=29158 RepID=A0A8B6GWQ2_MYTGA|nr:Hypothetical predicted protein [Mytilus galloprovincialis]